MNPKGNEFQITMLGASGVGKTTLLLAMYEKLELIAKDIGFKLIPDEETKKILDKYLEQLKSLQNQMRADERDKGLQGTKAIAGPDSLPKYVFDLVYKNSKIRLIFRDYPGGYLTSKDKMEREFVKKLIQESYGVIVTIDTPAMLEPKRENFQNRKDWDISKDSGKWHESRNQPKEVLELLKAACANPRNPKLVILAPVKCETYVQKIEDKDGNYYVQEKQPSQKLIAHIQEKYEPLLAFLQGRSENIAVITAPVQTVGCLHFWKYEVEDGNKPRFWFRKTSIDALYEPKNGDQLLRYLLSFLFKICNDQLLVERSPILRTIRELFGGDETPFGQAVKTFAQSRKENIDGFTIIQGHPLLFLKRPK